MGQPSTPEFKVRLDRAITWMRQYADSHPFEDGAQWFIMGMDFQVAVHALPKADLDPVVDALRTIKPLDWPGVMADSALDCSELSSEPGCYSMRMSERHRAIVGRHGERMFFLTLQDANSGQ